MKTKQISITQLNEYITSKNEEYLNLYANLPKLIKIISKLKKIKINLISKNDQFFTKISDDLSEKTFDIFLGETTFEDAVFFNDFPENLEKTTNFMILIDSIIGNLIYYLEAYNKTKAQYYIDNFSVLALSYQKVIFMNLVKKIYGSEDKNQIIDKTMIVASYSLYRFIYGYEHEMAKVAAVDLLMNSEILQKQYRSRVDISIQMNNLVNRSNVKNLYDALYNAGLFMEFTTAKNFLKALAQSYDVRLIKTLFTNYQLPEKKAKIGFYIYKIIIMTISDVLQNWRQYSKFKRELHREFRTSKFLIEEMIKDSSLTLSKLIY